MSDEENKKKIHSEPPPATDEIDDEWGKEGKLARGAGAASPAGSAAASATQRTAAGPFAGIAPTTAPEEDEDEEDEDEEDDEDDTSEDDASEDQEDEDEEDEDEEDEAHAQPAHGHAAKAAGQDWIPEWAPYAVLGLLVMLSIVVGLGLLGGSAKEGDENAAAPTGSALRKAPQNAAPEANPHQ